MPGLKRCQSCDAEFAADHSGPLCPACMLEKGLGDESRIETIEIKPGQAFCGHEIIRKIGVGGMGVVYEARQQALRRSVALKMIRTPSAATEKDMARFRQEAEAAARLNHPNIVEVYETGEFEGSPWFTMKYIEGARPLGVDLAKGPFDPKEAAKLVCEVARAVAYAHQRGVIHRDLKPANILLDSRGHPCLVDFGLAKLFGQSPSVAEVASTLSDDGKLIGTPHYMSPEQIRGEDLTTSTDVYSLGVVLYELLTGAPPFRSRSLNDIFNDISHLSPKPPDSNGKKMPRDLQVICLKCLRKNPKNRYGTADQLADDLQRWLDRRPIHARPSSTANRFAKWARRHPGVALLSPVVAVLAIAAMGLLFILWQNSINRIEVKIDSLLSEAGNQRVDKKAGRRWNALEMIREGSDSLDLLAAGKREEKRIELQNEAIACLSLIDLRPSQDRGHSWVGDPDESGLVRLSPNFLHYAHAAKDGRVVVRNRSNNKEILTLPNPGSAQCRSLRFSPDNLRLAAVFESGGDGFQFVVGDLERGVVSIADIVSGPDAVDFSADSSSIVFARDHSIIVASVDEGDASRELKIGFSIRSLRINRDSSKIAVTSATEAGAFLITPESEHVEKFDGPTVLDLDWNPRGRWLAMGCDDGRVLVWDTEAAEDSLDRELSLWSEGTRSAIEHLSWHPRGVLIAGTSTGGKLHLWHVAKGELEVALSGNVPQPQFSPDSPDHTLLGPVIEGNRVSLLEVAEGRLVSHARGHSGEIFGAWWRDLGPDFPSRVFSTAGNDGVRIWNRRGFEKAFIREPDARAAIFTELGLIITGSRGISIRPVTGGGVLDSDRILIGRPQRLLDDRCLDADYDPVHQRLAVATGDRIRVFQMSGGTGSEETSLPAAKHTAFLDISPDGEWLAAGTDGGSGIRIWNTGSWETVDHSIQVDGSADVVFYHDPQTGKDWFVTSGKQYSFFEVPTWAHQKNVSANLGKEIGALSLSPRTPVFAASEAGWIKTYTLEGFHPLISPEFDSQEPVCFSPGGTIFLSADRADRKTHLHLWDLSLLRSELKKLDLDLRLRPFEEIKEPKLIEEVILQEDESPPPRTNEP